MRLNYWMPVASFALLMGCGPGDIDKNENSEVVTDNAQTNSNQATNGAPGNSATNGTTNNATPNNASGDCSGAFERRVDGECVPAQKLVTLSVGHYERLDAGESSTGRTAGACVLERVGEGTTTMPDLEEAGCRARRFSPETRMATDLGYRSQGQSAGRIVFTVDGTAVEMVPPDGDLPCYQAPQDLVDEVVAAGAAVSVEVEGGSGVPAFTTDFAVPAAVAFETTEPTRGEALRFSWEPAGRERIAATVYAQEVIDGESFGVTITCSWEDTGSAEIPASMTDLMPEQPSYVARTLSVSDFSLTYDSDTAFSVTGASVYSLVDSF